MKLALLPLLLTLSLHASPRLARPISTSAGSSLRQIPTNVLSQPKANLPSPSATSSNGCLSLSDRLDVTPFNAHARTIRSTNVILTITTGAELSGPALASFLGATYDVVVRGVTTFGGASGLPMDILEWDQGRDLEFVAESVRRSTQALTWALTKEVIEELQRFVGGVTGYRETSCRVNLATGGKDLLGYVNVRRRKAIRQTNLVRSLPVPLSINNKNISFPSSLGINPNVHVDMHPSFFSRLDIRAVIDVLAVTKDWALENAERVGPNGPIDHGELWRSLADGVQIKMSAAPQKRLTYGLVAETVDRLLIWELDQHKKRGTAKAVEFGILDSGVLKGVGSIEKDKRHQIDIAK
ncbi:MAG: hypothetical protein Q9168_002319 [Polycauliona sp. 1 TL-2023]